MCNLLVDPRTGRNLRSLPTQCCWVNWVAWRVGEVLPCRHVWITDPWGPDLSGSVFRTIRSRHA